MTVEQLKPYLDEHWPVIREQMQSGTYKPQPVKRVEIPKPDGGMRKLGIPTVLDRFIQQAVMQVLQRKWDGTFSEHSYGFRPGRSAQQAVAKAQQYIAAGYTWCVDLDLEKFFDRVNHDKLMGRIAKRLEDKRVLKLIRAMLNAGVMEDGLVSPSEEGTPDQRRRPRVTLSGDQAAAVLRSRPEDLYRHCSVTSCWTSWTGSWSNGSTVLFAMRTIAISTFVASVRGNG